MNKCIIKIEAVELENGEVEVTSEYEGSALMLGTTLAECISNMENTDMHNIFAVFVKAQVERMGGKLKCKKTSK